MTKKGLFELESGLTTELLHPKTKIIEQNQINFSLNELDRVHYITKLNLCNYVIM